MEVRNIFFILIFLYCARKQAPGVACVQIYFFRVYIELSVRLGKLFIR